MVSEQMRIEPGYEGQIKLAQRLCVNCTQIETEIKKNRNLPKWKEREEDILERENILEGSYLWEFSLRGLGKNKERPED